MARLDGYDANAKPNEPMQPIPAGTYLAMIVESERKPNNAKTGEYLKVVFQICEGKYANRKITTFLNMWHPNEVAREIANGDFAAIKLAVGVMSPNDSIDLHNIPLEIIVGVTDPNAEGKIYNEIKGYQKRSVAVQQPQQAADSPNMPQQQPPQQQPNNMGWAQPQQ